MAKKLPPEGIQALREHRKRVQAANNLAKHTRQIVAQKQRNSLGKASPAKDIVPVTVQANPAKKKVLLPRINPINPNDVLNALECGVPFSAENIANMLNLDFSKGSHNRKFLATILDEFIAAGILIENKGRFTRPIDPDIEDKQTIYGAITRVNGEQVFHHGEPGHPDLTIENCFVPDGTVVMVTPTTTDGMVRILKDYGNIEEAEGIAHLSLLEAGIPIGFSQEALDETIGMSVPKASIFRKDYTYIPFSAIDPATAKDRDDAIHAEPLKQKDDNTYPNKKPEGMENFHGVRLRVAIADVAEYIYPGMKIYEEAYAKGVTAYLPGHTEHLHPEPLASGLCSLNQGEVRAAQVFTIDIAPDGHIIRSKVESALVKVHAAMSYDQVQDLIDGKAETPKQKKIYEELIVPLLRAHELLSKEAEARGVLDLDVSEQRIDYSRKTGFHMGEERKDTANDLVALPMIATNRCAAQKLKNKDKIPFLRVHGGPVQKVYDAYVPQLEKFGLVPDDTMELPDRVRDLVKQSHALPRRKGQKARMLLVRMQDRAKYEARQMGHYGLAIDANEGYAHFTSTIRRFSDGIVHRFFKGHDKKYPEFFTQERLNEAAKHITMCERRAEEAERKAKKRLLAKWLQDNKGRAFNARVVDIDDESGELKVQVLDRSIDAYITAPKHKVKEGEIIPIVATKADHISGVVEFTTVANGYGTANENKADNQEDLANTFKRLHSFPRMRNSRTDPGAPAIRRG